MPQPVIIQLPSNSSDNPPIVTEEEDQDLVDRTHLCANCYKNAKSSGKSLMHCAACKVAHYCDRSCQKANWKAHKPECEKLRKDRDEFDKVKLTEAEKAFLPDGLTPSAVDARLTTWSTLRSSLISFTVRNALRPSVDPKMMTTHCLWLTLRARPQSEHKDDRLKWFSLVSSKVLAFKDASKMGRVWADAVKWFEKQKRTTPGIQGLVVMQALPLDALRMFPIGGLAPEQMVGDVIREDWPQLVKLLIDQGIPFDSEKMIEMARAASRRAA